MSDARKKICDDSLKGKCREPTELARSVPGRSGDSIKGQRKKQQHKYRVAARLDELRREGGRRYAEAHSDQDVWESASNGEQVEHLHKTISV